MADQKLAGAWLRGCLRGIGLRIVVSIGVVGIFGILVLMALLLEPFLPGRGSGLIIAVSCFAALVFGGSGVYVAVTLLQRSGRYNEVFEPLGLEGSMYGIAGRQYHGTIGGRRVYAAFHRGPTLDLYVEAQTSTRLAIGLDSRIGQGIASVINTPAQPLDLSAMEYEGLVGSAHHPDWGNTFLKDDAVRASIPELISREGPALSVLTVQPGALHIIKRYIPQTDITAEAVRRWFDGLIEMAQVAEDLPAPTDSIEMTKLDQRWTDEGITASAKRMRTSMWIAAGIGGGLILCSVVIFVSVFAAASLDWI